MNYNSLTCAMRTYRARVFTLTWMEQYTYSLEANAQRSLRNEVLYLNFIYVLFSKDSWFQKSIWINYPNW